MQQTSFSSRKIARAAFITLLMSAAFLLFIFQVHFFLLLFGGIFFAVLLNYSSCWVTEKLKIKYGYSLVVVLLLIVVILTSLIFLLGPSIGRQVGEMVDTFPKSIKNLESKINETSLGRQLFEEIPDNPSDLIKDKKAAFKKVVGSFSTFVGVLANFLIVLITGIFLASSPQKYKDGFIRLFPLSFRDKLSGVMDKTRDILSLWMIAKLISMAVVGVGTAIGLQIIGIPLAYALAFIAALFSFIPNIGPYIALAPALLIAFLEGSDKVIYVLILYFGLQLIETYLITPLIEKKLVDLPPALTLFWMVLLGLLTGLLGLILATPILAALVVIVGELYVKDYLEKQE